MRYLRPDEWGELFRLRNEMPDADTKRRVRKLLRYAEGLEARCREMDNAARAYMAQAGPGRTDGPGDE